MPFKDPLVKAAYERERTRKRKMDPIRKAAKADYMRKYHKVRTLEANHAQLEWWQLDLEYEGFLMQLAEGA